MKARILFLLALFILNVHCDYNYVLLPFIEEFK